jgi:hypothetical protein
MVKLQARDHFARVAAGVRQSARLEARLGQTGRRRQRPGFQTRRSSGARSVRNHPNRLKTAF